MKLSNQFKIILFLFLLSISSLAIAQVKYGANLSGNYSAIVNANANSKFRLGLQFGGFAMIPMNSTNQLFYFQPELNYSMQGESGKLSNSSEEIDFYLNYLNLPLNFKYYFSESDNEGFILAGPYLGFLLSGKNDDLVDYSSFDIGLNGGLGYSIDRKYEFSMRAYYGFLDIAKDNASSKTANNAFVNFGFSYIF